MRLLLLALLAACDGPKDDGPSNTTDDTSTSSTDCTTVWYADADGDGFGNPDITVVACEPPGREVADDTDCDDANAAAYPGATEDCTTSFDANCDGSVGFVDADGDGTAACEDCDDTDASRHPGAAEFCDDVDQDCDDVADDEPVDGTYWYADADADGYGDLATGVRACEAPDGYIATVGDCDDTTAAASPGVPETCDGLDDDCDGSVDEPSAVDARDWYTDADGDGFGDDETHEVACDGAGVSTGGDCDDSDADVNPDATEVCDGVDDDCDGTTDTGAVDPATWYRDRDGDGWGDDAYTAEGCTAPAGYVADAGDCDDTVYTVSPDATETCDDVDDDCDGTVDEDDASDAATWYLDADADGYGDLARTWAACSAPSGYVARSTDCDDADAAVSPAARETCDAVDDDCDGTTDEDDAVDASTWYADADADGFGDPASTYAACSVPSGYTADATDCDDTDATVSPSGTETCDGEDDDCDGTADEPDAADAGTWYADADADGYGDAAVATTACTVPTGYLADGTDCDDADATSYPGAAEPDCDDPVDHNCDGSVGEVDGDADGYVACADCDDASASTSPLATELCNDIDDDCDGTVDEAGATGSGSWYADTDGDGYGDPGAVDHSCALPAGFVTDASDCDDTAAATHPGAAELCSTSADDDCDGDADELNTSDCSRWYLDFDADGYGSSTGVCACSAREDFVATTDDDCDDGDETIHPAATEVVGNGIDDDCDGLTDAGALADADATLASDGADAWAGYGLAAGDVDGDGTNDVLVGAYQADGGDTSSGAAYVFEAPFSGTRLTSAADASLLGATRDDGCGVSVALSDLDGDGYADALVGCLGQDAGGTSAGAGYLMMGPLSGSHSLSSRDAFLMGEASSDRAGTTVLLLGDYDGDGNGDLAIGAPGADIIGTAGGAAYLVLGAASGSIDLGTADMIVAGPSNSDGVGEALATADTNGDGLDDLVVGVASDDDAGSGSGTTYVLEGPTLSFGSIVGAANATIIGAAAGDGAGTSVASAGDVDGDGYDDLLIGAPDASTGGEAYLVLGPFSGRTSLSSADVTIAGASGDELGFSVAGPGDMDGDGVPDLAVGGYGNATGGTNAGGAWIFHSLTSGSYDTGDADASWYGVAGDRAGASMTAAGDVDGDGLDDLFIGAFEADDGATDGGAAYLVRGR